MNKPSTHNYATFTCAALVVMIASALFGCVTKGANGIRKPASGTFVGMEKMGNVTPDQKESRWFHENTLTIRGSRATLDKVPVVIQHGKKGYSSSDGGFYTYKGKLAFVEGRWVLHDMKLVMVDCGAVPLGQHPTDAEVRCKEDGSLLIDGVVYTKSAVNGKAR